MTVDLAVTLDTLLHYRILQPLGSGGMGDVYLAEDLKLGRRVALKVLPHGPSHDPERRQRFEREARAIAALNHPNIVTIHAVEQAADITFLTMELVEGQTLSGVMPSGGMPVRELLKIAIPLADAVAAAHERGITHRDLKPANVMVTAEGRVKVLDFGLAKLSDASPFGDASVTNLANSLTGEGRIVGTVAYMSPEQAEGKPVDARSDIFSLGVLLYEMATGLPIVPADNVRYDGVGFSPDGNFIYYVAYPGVQSFAAVYQVPVLGGTPRKIIDDVDTPLAFSPDGREFAFVRGSTARGETMVMIANADGTNARELAVSKNPLSYLLNNITWSPDGSTLVTIQRADLQSRGKLVAIDVKTGRQRDLGGLVWGYVDSVAWMPDGRGLVVAAQEDAPVAPTQVWYVSYPSGEVRRITNDLNSYAQVSVGADGRTIVVVQRESLAHLWVAPVDNASGGRQITSGTGQIEGMRGVAWTRDQRIVFTSSSSGHPDLWIVDASGANRRQLTADADDDFSPTVTPDGQSIVFPSNRPGASVWQMNLDGSNLRPLVTAPMARWPLVTADSKWVYYTSFAEPQRSLWRMPMTGGTPERLTRRWDAMGVNQDGVFFHPTMLLTGLMPDGLRGVGYYSDPAVRGSRVALVPLEGDGVPTPTDMRFSAIPTPDGRHLIHVDVRDSVPMLVRQPIAGGPAVVLGTFPNEGTLNIALSPDGRQLALSRGTSTSDVVLITQDR